MTNTTKKKAANSIVGKLTAAILAVAAVLPAGQALATGPVLVVGDSLEVGSGPYLRQALVGTAVEVDAKLSRSSAAGVAVLAAKLRPAHEVVVLPLGTNDTSGAVLGSSLMAARELAGERCMVVATIAKPGPATAQLNGAVEAFAGEGEAQLMDWRSAVGADPGLLGRDRIHATGQGYALRASLLAEAVEACLADAEFAGIPAPKEPVVRPPRPEPPPAPAARVPVAAALRSLAGMAGRPMSLVAGAMRAAQTAAMTERAEPVLGAER